jgi:hypothetical protein
VLARTEGATTTRASFSLDLSDATPGAVTIAKNVSVSPTSRADVGAHVKARLSMQGTTPRLDVDVDISSADPTGKLRHATLQGAAPTPAGAATVLLDAKDNGAQVLLTATPSATITLEGAADPSSAAYDLDVVVAHTGPGAPAKPTALTLKLLGDAPAIARVGESVPLSVGDAGATARQDVGTRVKVTGHGRGTSLELDFDLETSAVEQSSPAMRSRKIISRGHLVAPFDRETVAFSGEDDGHRYVVKLTPRRAKAP